MNNIKLVLSRMLNLPRAAASEAGQTLAEYGLMLSLVALGVTAISVVFFSSAVAGTFESVTACFGGSC
jgi:Flp pilus assembly pilin Flp